MRDKNFDLLYMVVVKNYLKKQTHKLDSALQIEIVLYMHFERNVIF